MYYLMDNSQSKTTTVEMQHVSYFEESQPKTSVDLDIVRSSQVVQSTTKYVTTSGEDESACWICGGFAKTKEHEKNWSFYGCCGSCITETKSQRTDYVWKFAPPFIFQKKHTIYDKPTKTFTKNDISSCSWSPIHWFCEFTNCEGTNYCKTCGLCVPAIFYASQHKSRRNGSEESEHNESEKCTLFCAQRETKNGNNLEKIYACWSPFNYTRSAESQSGTAIKKRKDTYWWTPMIFSKKHDISSEEGRLNHESTFCWWTPFNYSSNVTKIDRDKESKKIDSCIWTPFSCSSKSKLEKDKILANNNSMLCCWSPFNMKYRKTVDDVTTKKSAYGVLPLVCVNRNDKVKEVCGSTGVFSYCHRTDLKSGDSNYCSTCICGFGYCKRGRCCNLKEKAEVCNGRVWNCCRYLVPSEYESIGSVDMTAKTHSITCFGCGNCEIVPLHTATTTPLMVTAPSQMSMDRPSTVRPPQQLIEMEGMEIVPLSATKKIHVRTMCCVRKYYV